VLLDQQEATARVYTRISLPDQCMTVPPQPQVATVKLPSPGQKVVVTGCPNLPFAVLLADGSMVAVSNTGKTQPLADELKPIKAIASTRDSVAMTYGSKSQLALYDACATAGTGVFPNLPQIDVMALDIAASVPSTNQEMGLLSTDGKTVALFTLAGY
jgi:hypothetical protein